MNSDSTPPIADLSGRPVTFLDADDETVGPIPLADALHDLYGVLHSVGDNVNDAVGRLDAIEAGPKVFGYRSTAQTFTHNTFTRVQFNASRYDTAGALDTTVNVGRYTPPAGYYTVSAGIFTEPVAAGWDVSVAVFVNGAEYARLANHTGHGSYIATGGTAVVYLDGDDYLEIRLLQNTGSDLNTTSAGAPYVWFSAARIP